MAETHTRGSLAAVQDFGARHGHSLAVGQLVQFVEHQDLRHVLRADLREHALDFLDAPVALGIGAIHDMQEQIRVARLGQRRLERCDEIVRQVADESDRIGEHERPAIQAVDAAQGRIKRGEQLVRRVHAGTGQRIEQGGFARVRVTDQRDQRQRVALARAPRGAALRFDFFQALTELFDARGEQAAVEFELGFARTAQADRAAALALQMGPAAHQARGHVLELREFDLQFALVRARALGEDVEDQSGAIDHAALRELFEVAFLHRR